MVITSGDDVYILQLRRDQRLAQCCPGRPWLRCLSIPVLAGEAQSVTCGLRVSTLRRASSAMNSECTLGVRLDNSELPGVSRRCSIRRGVEGSTVFPPNGVRVTNISRNPSMTHLTTAMVVSAIGGSQHPVTQHSMATSGGGG